MRRLSVVLGAVALTLAGGVAQAATTSVTGTGSYEKLVVNNAQANLVFKIHAPGGGCDIKYLTVKFRDRDGTRYAVAGGCYGAEWAPSLSRGEKLVECDGFRLRFDRDKGVWTAKVPRECLKGLGGAVKVTESYVDDWSPMPGEVPPTKYVARG